MRAWFLVVVLAAVLVVLAAVLVAVAAFPLLKRTKGKEERALVLVLALLLI